MQLAGALQQLVQDETGALGTGDPDQLVEGLDPLLGLLGVDIRKLVLELVEDIVHFRVSHAFILGGGGLEVTLKNPGRVRAGLILAAAVAIVLAAINLTRPTATTAEPTPSPSSAGTVAVAQPLAAAESPRFSLSGVIRGDDGRPIAAALACDHPAFSGAVTCARSQGDGAFACCSIPRSPIA